MPVGNVAAHEYSEHGTLFRTLITLGKKGDIYSWVRHIQREIQYMQRKNLQ